MDHSPSQHEFEFAPGTLIAGRYEVVRKLGHGAMGLVVEVLDRELDNDVIALKLLYTCHVSDKTLLARFRNEVLLTRCLAHPNIVRIYDFGHAGRGYYYISMEYVNGRSLGSIIQDPDIERFSFNRALEIIVKIAQGINEAHRRRVIHRDLKPDNIIISKSGAVKITDFGLARSLAINRNLTQPGESVGTPYYMSPEQIRGEEVDCRSDIYSLGILAYELVAYKRPFEHDTWLNLASMHLRVPLPNIRKQEPNVPNWFQVFLERATAKDRKQRYKTVTEVIEALAPHLSRSLLVNLCSSSVLPALMYQGVSIRRKYSQLAVGASICVLMAVVAVPQVFRQINNNTVWASAIKCPEHLNQKFTKAVVARDITTVQALLEEGLSVDTIVEGFPVLLYAIEQQNYNLIKVLIKHGADPTHEYSCGRTAISYAKELNDAVASEILFHNRTIQ